MKFYEYFKEEWEKEQGFFTNEELEEMGNVERLGDEVINTSFIDSLENFLDFMDKSKYSKRFKKDIDRIPNNYKKEIAKELVHRILIYAVEYFDTKRNINNKEQKAFTKMCTKRDIKSFKRYKNPTDEQRRKREESKKKLKELNKTPKDKLEEAKNQMIDAFLQALLLIDKFAINCEEKNKAMIYMHSLVNDLKRQDFIKTKRHLFYDSFSKTHHAIDKTAIKNYLLEINDHYGLNAKTKINEFCRNICPLFDQKRKKNLKKFKKVT